jgi:hypothetical protein
MLELADLDLDLLITFCLTDYDGGSYNYFELLCFFVIFLKLEIFLNVPKTRLI